MVALDAGRRRPPAVRRGARPGGRRPGRPRRRRPAGRACSTELERVRTGMRIDVVIDLPGLPGAAATCPSSARLAARACSTCACTTCATSPTTGTARSTTRPTAAAPAWSCGPSRGARRSTPCSSAVRQTGVPHAARARRRRACGSPGDGPGAGRRAVAGLRLRSLRGHRRARAGRRRAPGAGVRRSALGDYVLGGGEVAVLAIVEAVARLLPGVIGNAECLVEESHEDGLLEYPVYTKPAVWRGLDVPPVLLSGHHGPCPLAPGRAASGSHRRAPPGPALAAALDAGGLEVRPAQPADAEELAVLQRACWLSEAVANSTLDIPALSEDADEVRRGFAQWQTWVVRSGGTARRLGARPRLDGDPRTVGDRPADGGPGPPGPRDSGAALLAYAEAAAPAGTRRLWINTGTRSAAQPAPLPPGRVPGTAGRGTVPRDRRPRQGRSRGRRDFVSRLRLWQNSALASAPAAPLPRGSDPRARMRVTRPAGRIPPFVHELPVVTCGTARKRHRHAHARRRSTRPASATTSRRSAPATRSRSTSRSSRAPAPGSRSSRVS